jgi:ketosteroid isomerase-like protein
VTDHNPAAVANRYFGALASGDIPAAMALFSPEVVWHQPGANRFSGAHHGPDEVGALLGGMMEASAGSFQLTVTGAPMVNGDLVAVPVRFTGQREGSAMDMTGIDLLTVSGGSIAAVKLFSEDGAAEDDFWGTV